MRTTFSFTTILFLAACAAAQPPVRFAIETPNTTITNAALIAFDADAVRVSESGEPRTLARVLEVRRENADVPAWPTRHFALLTNGDRIPLDPDKTALLEDGRVRVWPTASLPTLQEKGISLFAPHLVLLFWTAPDGIDDAELFFAKLEKEARKRDVVYRKNGDRIEGTIVALSAKDGCAIESLDRKIETPWNQLAGIAWNTDRQAKLRTKKTHWRAALEGGARINLLEARFNEKSRRWTGVTQFGPSLELPESSVLALDVRLGPAVDLADLTPSRYEHRPYLGVSWPLNIDASATGHPLRLHGSAYERGLGMHAACETSYKLDGQYERFLAVVGIDDKSWRGRARAAILLDGKRIDLNEGKELTSQAAPIRVHLDVRGVRTLSLAVDLGSFGDVQANVNWAKARLVKKSV